jgi:hypothetical protein
MSPLRSLTVSLVHAAGPFLRPRLELAIHVSGMIFDAGAKGQGSVAERKAGFADFDLGDREFRDLCRAAEEAGFPDRIPQVEAVVDTSLRAAIVTLQVSHEKGMQSLRLPLMSSGFKGADAPALQRFFSILLTKAGIRDASILFDLTGDPEPR